MYEIFDYSSEKDLVIEVKQSKSTGKDKMGQRSQLGFSLAGALTVLCSVCCEIGKQISNYGIIYYNGGSYPLQETILVTLKQTKIR